MKSILCLNTLCDNLTAYFFNKMSADFFLLDAYKRREGGRPFLWQVLFVGLQRGDKVCLKCDVLYNDLSSFLTSVVSPQQLWNWGLINRRVRQIQLLDKKKKKYQLDAAGLHLIPFDDATSF